MTSKPFPLGLTFTVFILYSINNSFEALFLKFLVVCRWLCVPQANLRCVKGKIQDSVCMKSAA